MNNSIPLRCSLLVFLLFIAFSTGFAQTKVQTPVPKVETIKINNITLYKKSCEETPTQSACIFCTDKALTKDCKRYVRRQGGTFKLAPEVTSSTSARKKATPVKEDPDGGGEVQTKKK
jgi:hypothetical protein